MNRKIGSLFAQIVLQERHELPDTEVSIPARYTGTASLSERESGLIATLLEIVFRHRHQAGRPLMRAVRAVARQIRRYGIALTDRADSPRIFGRRSLLPALVEEIEPVLMQLLIGRAGEFIRGSLAGRRAYPLSRFLGQPADCERLANEWASVAELSLLFLSEELHTNSITCQRMAAGIKMISDVLHVIGKQLPHDNMRWCDSCFRRAPEASHYCRLHLPICNDGKSKDTGYRRGRMMSKDFQDTEKESYKRYRLNRRLLGDAFIVASNQSQLGMVDPIQGRLLMIDPNIEYLVLETQTRPWLDIRDFWSRLISNETPAVHSRIRKEPTDCADWGEFVIELMRALDDPTETTRHPYWVLEILVEAEDWFQHEGTYVDKRRNSTPDLIFDLHRQGLKRKDISIQTGKSPSYVSRVIKKKEKGGF